MSGVILNRRLMLETSVRIGDGAGGFNETWAPLGRLWAQVRPGSGRDTGGQDVALSSLPLKITVRGAPQGAQSRPRPGQRFREGARVFGIEAVSESTDGCYLLCNAREELAT